MGKSSRIRSVDRRFRPKKPSNADIEKSCLSKTTYHNRFDAQNAAAYASQQSGESVDYYYCDFCAFYHLSRKKY